MTPTVEWREFERTALIDEVTESLRAGRCVVLHGEAGVGKTTLARQAAPAESAWLHCLEGLKDVALAPFSFLPTAEPVDSVAEAYTWLRHQADSGTTLVVDDAHWIDTVSAGLIAQSINQDGIRTIVIARSGQPLPGDLERALLDCHGIAVEPLDPSMVELALELALGNEPDSNLVDTFTAWSGGNALYLRELVLEAVTDGALLQDSRKVWALKSTPTTSTTIGALLDARLQRLGDSGRRAVELVVAAEHLPSDCLEQLVGPQAVASAVDAALLKADGSEIHPGHPAVHAALAARMSAIWRRALLSELADVADSCGIDTTRKLRWVLELELVPDAADLERGYEAATRTLDDRLAGRIARAAYEYFPSVPNGLRFANELERLDEHRQVVSLLGSLRETADSEGSVRDVALVATHALRVLGSHETHPDDTSQELASSFAEWADDRLGDTSVSSLLAASRALLESSRLVDGAEQAEALTRPLRDHDVEAIRMLAHDLFAKALILRMETKESLASAEAILSSPDRYYREIPAAANAVEIMMSALQNAGDLERWLDSASEFSALLGQDASPNTVCSIAISHAKALAEAGDLDDAAQRLQYAEAHASAAQPWQRGQVQHWMARVETERGNPTRSAEASQRARERLEVISFPEALDRLDAFRDAIYGDREHGIERLRLISSDSLERGFPMVHRDALVSLARLGHTTDDTIEGLSAIAETSPHAELALELAVSLRSRDVGRLRRLADRAEEQHRLGFAVEVLARAADISTSDGDRSTATSIAERHNALFGTCPGLRWPLATIAVDAPDLTARERQVAELAALGWSNRQISDELGISVRTVENNLQRAYAKLGINRRTDLSAALGLQAA